jgi:hypothetical protein
MKILAWDIGIKNLSYCLYDTQLHNNIIDWNVIDISQNGKEIFNLQEEMVKQLDLLPHLRNVDYVVLENQPTFNIKMKTIASALYTYFVIRGCIDHERQIKNICYVHPKQKLTQCQYDGPDFESTKKQKYQRDKETAIVYCKYFLRDCPEWLNILESSKKADDMSDSMLHAKAFFNKFVLEELKSTPVDQIKQMARENGIPLGKKDEMVRLLYPIVRSSK